MYIRGPKVSYPLQFFQLSHNHLFNFYFAMEMVVRKSDRRPGWLIQHPEIQGNAYKFYEISKLK